MAKPEQEPISPSNPFEAIQRRAETSRKLNESRSLLEGDVSSFNEEIKKNESDLERERLLLDNEAKAISQENYGLSLVKDSEAKKGYAAKIESRRGEFNSKLTSFNDRMAAWNKTYNEKKTSLDARSSDYEKQARLYNAELEELAKEQQKKRSEDAIPKVSPATPKIDKGEFAKKYASTEKVFKGPSEEPIFGILPVLNRTGDQGIFDVDARNPFGRRDFVPDRPNIINGAVVDDQDGKQNIVVRDSATLAKVTKDYPGTDIPIYMNREMDNTIPNLPSSRMVDGDTRNAAQKAENLPYNPMELSEFTAKGKAYESETLKDYSQKMGVLEKAVAEGRLSAKDAELQKVILDRGLALRHEQGPRSFEKISKMFRDGKISLQYAKQALKDQGIGVDDFVPERASIPRGRGEAAKDQTIAIKDYLLGAKDITEIDKIYSKAENSLHDALGSFNPGVDKEAYIQDFAVAKAMKETIDEVATEISKSKGVSFEDARKLALKDRTFLDKTIGSAQGLIKAITTDAIASFAQAGVIGVNYLGQATGLTDADLASSTPGARYDSTALQRAYNWIEDVKTKINTSPTLLGFKNVLQTDPRITGGLEEAAFAEKLAAGIGSMVAYIGASGLGKFAARGITLAATARTATKVAADLEANIISQSVARVSALSRANKLATAGRIGSVAGGTALYGAPAQIVDAYQFAKTYGLSDKEAVPAILGGIGISFTEYLPLAKYLDDMPIRASNLFYKNLLTRGAAALSQGFEEGIQESGSGIATNLINYYNALRVINNDLASTDQIKVQDAQRRLEALEAGQDGWIKNQVVEPGLIGLATGGFIEGARQLAASVASARRINGIQNRIDKTRQENSKLLGSSLTSNPPQITGQETPEVQSSIKEAHSIKRVEGISNVVGEPVSKNQAEDIDVMGTPKNTTTSAQFVLLEKAENEAMKKAQESKEKMREATTADDYIKAEQEYIYNLGLVEEALNQRVNLSRGVSNDIKARHSASKDIALLSTNPETAPLAKVIRIALKVVNGRQDLLNQYERQEALNFTAGVGGAKAFIVQGGQLQLTPEGLARIQEKAPESVKRYFPQAAKQQQQQTQEQPKTQIPPPQYDKNGNLKNGADKTKPPEQRKNTQPPARVTRSPLTTEQSALATKVAKVAKSLIKIDLPSETVRRIAEAIVRKNPNLTTSQITQATTQFFNENQIAMAPTGIGDRAQLVQMFIDAGYSPADAEAEADYKIGEYQKSVNSIEEQINKVLQSIESQDEPLPSPRVALRQLSPHELRKLSGIANTLKVYLGYEVNEETLARLAEIIAKRSRVYGITSYEAVQQFVAANRIPVLSSPIPSDPKAVQKYEALARSAASKLEYIVSQIEGQQVNDPSERQEPPEVERTRDLIVQYSEQYSGAFQFTGAVMVEFGDTEVSPLMDNLARMVLSRGFAYDKDTKRLIFNANAIAKARLTDSQIKMRLFEEITHAVAVKLKLPAKQVARMLRSTNVRGTSLANIVAKTYSGSLLSGLAGERLVRAEELEKILIDDDFALAHEYVRMLVQFAIEGKITENTDLIIPSSRTWLQAILDFLKQYILQVPNDQLIKNYVEAIKQVILAIPAKTAPGIQGIRGYIETPTGASFDAWGGSKQGSVRYTIIDYKDAVVNRQIGSSQNRDRTSAVSRQQIDKIKADLNPGRVTEGAVISVW
ncbi:MAG: hypothetical protein EBU82_07440 [Flavobacteriia bacterium]|nr:hypothetical protein [Flavobacteriia bacterium]